jgi:cysteine desulfurase/selenocysteine lyase
MYAPFGIGVLYGTERMLDAMPPFMGGGDMISEVRLEGFSVNELPYKFEAGTPPVAQAVGLEAAADWLSSVGIAALGEYESRSAALMDGIVAFGHTDSSAARRGPASCLHARRAHSYAHDVAATWTASI